MVRRKLPTGSVIDALVEWTFYSVVKCCVFQVSDIQHVEHRNHMSEKNQKTTLSLSIVMTWTYELEACHAMPIPKTNSHS